MKFIKVYSIISKGLTNLLKKGVPYVCPSETEGSYQALKEALYSAPMLALSDSSKCFVVETDPCDRGIGDVMHQDEHTLAFLSKALGPKHQALSTYEKECLTILLAMDKWHPYLQYGEFWIKIDQQSLVNLTDQRQPTPWQHKALTKLL